MLLAQAIAISADITKAKWCSSLPLDCPMRGVPTHELYSRVAEIAFGEMAESRNFVDKEMPPQGAIDGQE